MNESNQDVVVDPQLPSSKPDVHKAHHAHGDDDMEFSTPSQALLHKVMSHKLFDYSMGVVILFNTAVIVVETDHAPQTVEWAVVGTWVISTLFLAELFGRIYVHRCVFWHDPWHWFDFVVVVADLLFSIAGLIFGDSVSVSFLRIFRLFKLARISKLFHVFPELRLMMAGLVGACRAIFWGVVLLTVVLLVWAILAVQLLHPLNQKLAEDGVLDGCERCPRAYQSVFHSLITFCQQIVAGDSWGQATIPLIEAYPFTGLFFMGVFLSVGMAVLNLILGVVVNVAQQAHDTLEREMEGEKELAKMEANNHLREMCLEMDRDGSGELSREEVFEGFQDNEEFRNCILGMDLEQEDLQIVWGIVDVDKSGTADYDEFVNQIYKLKSSDTTFMLAYIKYYIIIIKDKIVDLITNNDDALMHEEEMIKAEMVKMEAGIEREIHIAEEVESEALKKMQGEEEQLLQCLASTTEPPAQSQVQAAQKKVITEEKAMVQERPRKEDKLGVASNGLVRRSRSHDRDAESSFSQGYQLISDAELEESRRFRCEWREMTSTLLKEMTRLQPNPWVLPTGDFGVRPPSSASDIARADYTNGNVNDLITTPVISAKKESSECMGSLSTPCF